jgi:hypothetical protein
MMMFHDLAASFRAAIDEDFANAGRADKTENRTNRRRRVRHVAEQLVKSWHVYRLFNLPRNFIPAIVEPLTL